MLPLEFSTISELLEAIDDQIELLRRRDECSWLSIDRIQRSNAETRAALKVLTYSRPEAKGV